MRSWRKLLLLLFTLPLLAAGCQKDEAITRETVAYPDREELRLLAALVPFRYEGINKDILLVFKLQGPAKEVEEQSKAFDAFLASVQFDDKAEPPVQWKAPPGWKEEGSSKMRLATFRIAAEPKPMEMTASILPLHKEDDYLAPNVERWRKQLNRPPVPDAELHLLARRQKIGGKDGYVVNLAGFGTHAVSTPGPAPAAPHPPITPQRPPQRGRELPFTYDVPQSWQKDERPAGISVASYTVKEGAQSASVTLTAAGGDWVANINRWRGQVDLPQLQEAELAREVATWDVAGAQARFVDANNPNKTGPASRILGAIVPLRGQTWFFKMTGPSEVVGRHKAEFESFVKSIKLGGKE